MNALRLINNERVTDYDVKFAREKYEEARERGANDNELKLLRSDWLMKQSRFNSQLTRR